MIAHYARSSFLFIAAGLELPPTATVLLVIARLDILSTTKWDTGMIIPVQGGRYT